MEYKSIFLLPNQYPNIANYDTQPNSDMILNGVYPQNFLEFRIPSLDDLEVVENTSFRYILEVKETSISDEARYFTSPVFFEDLQTSKIENNPYHLQTGLDEGLFVKITLDRQIGLFNKLKLIDFATGVRQNQNLFLRADNSIDYVTLVQYVDWLVGRVNPLDDETNGVIPAEKIADFEIGKYDPITGEFITIQDQAVEIQNRIDALNQELEEVEEAIQAVTSDLPQEPKKRKTSVLEIVSLGLGALAVAQGAAAAIKGGSAAFGAAANAAKGAPKKIDIVPLERTRVGISSGPPSFASKLTGQPGVALSASTSTIQAGTKAAKTFGSFARKTFADAKKIANTVKDSATKFAKQAAKGATAASKFVSKQAGTAAGQAIIGATGQAVVASAGTTGKKQTDIVLKSVAKSAAVEVGKAIVKKVITKGIIKGAAAKILGAATGPIGAGIMAAVGIVKFFVGKAKQKKEFKKQKAEYDKVMGELERLTKRKEEIESELNGLLKNAKLAIAQQYTDRFSSTEKYFSNIGKSAAEASVAIPAVSFVG
jgi:prefoldin subunit 5